jgi:hypothetical protein
MNGLNMFKQIYPKNPKVHIQKEKDQPFFASTGLDTGFYGKLII